MVTRPAEDEVQEITIEMKEENKPFGTLTELLLLLLLLFFFLLCH